MGDHLKDIDMEWQINYLMICKKNFDADGDSKSFHKDE